MIFNTFFLVLLTMHGGSYAQSCGAKRKMDCKVNCPGGNSVGHWRHKSTTDYGCCRSFWDCFGTRKHCEFICDKCSKEACPAGHRYRHGANHRTNKSGSARQNECCVQNVCKCDNGQVASGTCQTHNAQKCERCNAGYRLDGGVCKANTCKCSNGRLGDQSNCARNNDQNCGRCHAGYKLVGRECRAKTCKCTNGREREQSTCIYDDQENCDRCDKGFRLKAGRCFREYTYPESNAWVVIENLVYNQNVINLAEVTAFDSSDNVVNPLTAEFNIDTNPRAPATNCINGKTDMCHSDDNGRDARLRIKYAADADIHRVVVANRVGGYQDRIAGASIRVIAGGLTQWSDGFDGTKDEYTFTEVEAFVPAQYTHLTGNMRCKMHLGESRKDAVDVNHCLERCTFDDTCIAVTWQNEAKSCVLHPVCDDQETVGACALGGVEGQSWSWRLENTETVGLKLLDEDQVEAVRRHLLAGGDVKIDTDMELYIQRDNSASDSYVKYIRTDSKTAEVETFVLKGGEADHTNIKLSQGGASIKCTGNRLGHNKCQSLPEGETVDVVLVEVYMAPRSKWANDNDRDSTQWFRNQFTLAGTKYSVSKSGCSTAEVYHIAPEIDELMPCYDAIPFCQDGKDDKGLEVIGLESLGFCDNEDPSYVETQCARTCGLCADRSALQNGHCNPNTAANRLSRDTGFRSLESCFKARCANVPDCAAVSFGASHADHSPECVAYRECPSFKEDAPGYTTRMKPLQKGTCKSHTRENVLETFTDESLESCYENRCADVSTCAAVSFEGTTCTTYKECTGVEPSNKETKLKELRTHAKAGICAGHDDDWTAEDKPAGAKNWELHTGLGWRTGDRLSVDQCRHACHLQIGCGHFSVSNQFCYLFKGDSSDCDTSENDPVWLEKFAHKTLLDATGMICREKDLPLNEGGSLDQQMFIMGLPRDQCEALCMFDVRCRAFAWNRSNMRCHFKWGFDPNAANQGWGRKSHRKGYDFCYKPEVAGAPRQRTDLVGDFCWKDTYVRGIGEFPSECPEHKEKIGLLCYDKCPSGYYRARGTFDCHQYCPDGYRDDGLFCRPTGKKGTEYGRGIGYGWWWGKGGMERCEAAEGRGKCEWHGLLAYPKCEDGYENIGCCICRRKMVDCKKEGMNPGLQWLGDTSCAKKMIFGAASHSLLQCKEGREKSGGICYRKCTEGYEGASFACWGIPPKGWVNCGFGAARSEFHCAVVIGTQTIKTLSVIWSWFVGPALGGGLEATKMELLRGLGEMDYNMLGNQAFKYVTNPANDAGMVLSGMDLGSLHDAGAEGKYQGQEVKFEDLSDEQQARMWMGMAEYVDITGFVGAAQAFLYPTCDDMPKILMP